MFPRLGSYDTDSTPAGDIRCWSNRVVCLDTVVLSGSGSDNRLVMTSCGRLGLRELCGGKLLKSASPLLRAAHYGGSPRLGNL